MSGYRLSGSWSDRLRSQTPGWWCGGFSATLTPVPGHEAVGCCGAFVRETREDFRGHPERQFQGEAWTAVNTGIVFCVDAIVKLKMMIIVIGI